METVTSQSLLYKIVLLGAVKFYLPLEPESGFMIAWSSFKVINQHWFSFLVILAFNSHTKLLSELRLKVTALGVVTSAGWVPLAEEEPIVSWLDCHHCSFSHQNTEMEL